MQMIGYCGLREYLFRIIPMAGIEISKEEREDITKEALKKSSSIRQSNYMTEGTRNRRRTK